MNDQGRKDLVVLVPCKNMQYSIEALLGRPQAFGIRPPVYEVRVHPKRDPGVFRQCHDFLRPFLRSRSYALVLCDREGCGREARPRERLEADMEERLRQNGWEGRSAAVVLDPELEVWFWSDSPHVREALGWKQAQPAVSDWLEQRDYLRSGQRKPARPKEAVQEALRLSKKPRSSSVYFELAQNVSFEHCSDPAFGKFKTVLERWFALGAQ
jgi:hypothetical protein